MSPFYDRKDDDTGLRLVVGAIVGLGLLTLVWLFLSGPGEQRLSGTSAFDQSGPSRANPRVPRAIERRTGTGLDMVSVTFADGPSATRPEESSPYAGAPETAAPPAGETAASTSAPAPQAAASVPAADPKELAAAGLPTDPKGLQRLGAEKGLLSAAVRKLMDHPRILKAILDNKLVVDAVMGRDTSKRNCSDPGALKAILSDPKSGPMVNLYPLVQQALSKPASAAAMLSSELGSRIMDCPSTKAMTSDPSMMMSVAMGNPAALKMVSDPRVVQTLTTNPQAAGMFANVQSGLGGMTGGR